MCKRLMAIVFCLYLLASMALPAYAVEEAKEPTPIRYSIVNKEDFLEFAEQCRLDSFSQNLEVVLKSDINLTGTGFAGIPIFCGTFQGNDHTIRGVEISHNGSYQGLFRNLTDTAVVQNLHVSGTVQPGGSKTTVGGIAGYNAGKILNCSFTGTVSGADYVGGIAGESYISALIENCTVNGQIYGSHFVGGIAGKNSGIIRECENRANVNDSAQHNTVSLTDITIESITGSESAGTVTDIGGIAGNSIGVIRDCENFANIGYQQMGYNIGGIVGTQSGSVLDCENHGQVHGRKDIGGIVGQLEPTALISFEEDALQILQRQLDGLGGIVSATASNVRGTGDQIVTQVGTLKDYVTNAKDAVESLVPTPENPELPDKDAMQAAQNAISSSVSGMTETLRGMQESTYSSIGALSSNLHAMQSQMNAMRSTLGNISQTLGGSITDVSDQDTEEDLSGKVSGCVNSGLIVADRNAGGIAGAIGLENDLDMEEDWSILGDNSLNFESELRAVVLNCVNQSTVTCKKQKVGGIVGWQSLGLVKNCLHVGDLDAKGAAYAGGISGQSLGYIRSSFAKGKINAGEYAGGIAGMGRIVTDCRSITEILGVSEHCGAILGMVQEDLDTDEPSVAGNVYFSPGLDLGGIDGISYFGQAEALDREAFLTLEGLPETFREVYVTFRYPSGKELRLTVPLGEDLSKSRVPGLPEKSGYEAFWDGLENSDLEQILFDMTFDVQYLRKKTVLQTNEGGSLPQLLVQGLFAQDSILQIESYQGMVPMEDGESLAGAWTVRINGAEAITGLRLRLKEGNTGKHVKLLLQREDGSWHEPIIGVDGSYLTAPLHMEDCTIALIQMPSYWEMAFVAAAGITIVLLAGYILKRKEKHR